MSVVLPAPLVPTIATTSPEWASKDTRRSTEAPSAVRVAEAHLAVRDLALHPRQEAAARQLPDLEVGVEHLEDPASRRQRPLERRVEAREPLDGRVHGEQGGQERREGARGEPAGADGARAVEERSHEGQPAHRFHQGRQDGRRTRDPHAHVEQPRRGAPEALRLEPFHGERLHDPEARDRLLEDLRDVAPAPERGLVARAEVPPEPHERVEGEGHGDERQHGEPPVLHEQDHQQPDDGEALLEEVARHLGHRVLDLLDVRRDVAHQRARRVAAQEGERLPQDVLVEAVPEVGDRALPGRRHQRGREVGAEALERVEDDDGQGHPADAAAPGEHVVEDRLHHVDEPGARRGVAGGEHPREEEQPAVRRGEREQPTELVPVAPDIRREAGGAAHRPRHHSRTAPPRGRGDGGGRRERYGLISLLLRVLAGQRTAHYRRSAAALARKRRTRPSLG